MSFLTNAETVVLKHLVLMKAFFVQSQGKIIHRLPQNKAKLLLDGTKSTKGHEVSPL